MPAESACSAYAQSCSGPRPPCTRPCAMMCVSVCREGAQKYLEELDVKAVGIKDDKKEAMAKMWNK